MVDYYDRIRKKHGIRSRYPTPEEYERRRTRAMERVLVPRGAITFGVDPESGRYAWMMPDELAYGLWIVGRPGQGKSNAGEYIGSQIIDLVLPSADESFIVIDPHGAAAEHLFAYCVQKGVDPQRLLYVDFKPRPFVPIFNPLRPDAFSLSSRAEGITLAAYNLVEAMMRAFGVEFAVENPLTAEAMITTAAALAANNYSYAETKYFTQNAPGYREIRSHLLEAVEDETIVNLWHEIADLPAREQRIERASAARRFNWFLRIKTLERSLGQTSRGIDFSEIIGQGKIAIFNLGMHNTGLSDQAQRFLGALLLSQLKAAVSRRRKNESAPCYLFIDEFSRFVSHDTMEALAEARGFGLRPILAHQRLDQLRINNDDPRLLRAVMSIPNKLVFSIGLVDDQLQVAKEMYGPWVDHYKKKLELKHRAFAPALKKVLVAAESMTDGEVVTDIESEGTSEYEADGAGLVDATAAGIITPPDGGLFGGASPTTTELGSQARSRQHMAGGGASSARGHAVAKPNLRSRSLSEQYITDHDEYEETSVVEFQTFDEQVQEHMQKGIRQDIGQAVFMRGYKEPPISVETPEQEQLSLEPDDEDAAFRAMGKSQPECFMPVVSADQALVDRKETLKLKASSASTREASSSSSRKPRRKKPAAAEASSSSSRKPRRKPRTTTPL